MPEAQIQLFKAFSQADGSTTRKYGGTGLGLAISKRLVELMGGGEIGVDSVVNAGSTFWFTVRLPIGSPLSQSSSDHYALLFNLRVLCVDDNASSLGILEAQLRAWGMHPGGVSDGETALAQLRQAQQQQSPYDLAILDLEMPGMNGLDLARAIRAVPELASLPLVLLSPFSQRGLEEEAHQAGITACVYKPVRLRHLYDSIAVAMRQKPNPTAGAERRTHPSADQLQGLFAARVLVVEDNVVNQKIATRMIEKLGCRVDIAANGHEAINAIANRSYALVFMDCQMPELDGFTATAMIRESEVEGEGRLPIIAMTANAMQGDRERCLEAGMDDYVGKPVQFEDLIDVLQKWLPHADVNAETGEGVSS